jgi:NH3-dependent NAD+ synthetase
MDIGVPAEIIQKSSSADLNGNVPWENVPGVPYEQLDHVLFSIEKRYEGGQLIQIFRKELIEVV